MFFEPIITVDKKQLRDATDRLGAFATELPKELSIAINRTTTRTATSMSKRLRAEVTITAAFVRKVIDKGLKATPKRLYRAVTLIKTERPSLKEYGAKHIKKGVSYRMTKSGGRKTVPGGFMGPKPGAMAVKLHGHPFKRLGKDRLPIVKLHGASPWAVYKKHQMIIPEQARTQRELFRQFKMRINGLIRRKGL